MLNREEELRFCKARRAAIALDYQNLNPEQRRAALATDGPLLLLAGAGSGKTTVLIHRIANLMKYAVIIITTVPIMCVYPFVQKYFSQGVMIGAIKG